MASLQNSKDDKPTGPPQTISSGLNDSCSDYLPYQSKKMASQEKQKDLMETDPLTLT